MAAGMARVTDGWDGYLMKMAWGAASKSKDPSTQVGAVIVDDAHVICGVGYNGFPRGIDEGARPEFTWERPGKYNVVVHAEANAILFSSSDRKGDTIYCTRYPCCECTKLIIQKGIRTVVYDEEAMGPSGAAHTTARAMLEESGITIRRVSLKT